MRVNFTIPGTLPNLNDMINANRRNRYAGANQKRTAQAQISKSLVGVGHIESPVRVHFHWIEPNMRRDKDNIAAAKKFILDELVDEGILSGDGWKDIIGFEDTFFVDKINPRIEVEIWHQE